MDFQDRNISGQIVETNRRNGTGYMAQVREGNGRPHHEFFDVEIDAIDYVNNCMNAQQVLR